MSVSLLGGQYKGVKLSVPPENITRPTAVQLKRKVFDANQHLDERKFIDLCAGSGSIGFEALSRGAEEVVFVEKNRKASQLLKKNIQHLEQKVGKRLEGIQLFEQPVSKWLKQSGAESYLGDDTIYYLDPPYELTGVYDEVLQFLMAKNFSGEVWLEGCRQKGKPYDHWREFCRCENYKVYEQGTSFILRLMFSVA